MIPTYWEAAKAHLRAVDPVMAAVIDAYEDPPLRSKRDVFQTLVHAIVGQQISAKAADAVWGRFVAEVREVTPSCILEKSVESLRGVGLSGRKVEYIQGLAHEGERITSADWDAMSDDEVRRTLIALRGVGPWTAEMVLIFSLLRADILPLGDIGVIRAVEQLYRGGDRMSVEEVAEVAEAGPLPHRRDLVSVATPRRRAGRVLTLSRL